ncbi:MAG: tRNA (adenosine(37)-N6)-dimethylallyltransferase MiaA [Bdellovibrionales bacterium]|jgi:tRNA dimethylallyltransferase|nr:tRNA (adenosine(37)-N6)-dimethylallyltransferase MiaA [Bdellovibrionales bacterium]
MSNNINSNKIIILSGATATGKTKTSIQIALELEKKLNKKVAIVNFDSTLFYNELNIGTAKPTEKEMQGVPHYLINIRPALTPINAFEFSEIATLQIEKLLKLNHIILLVGGSAFYIRALIKGMYSENTNPDNHKIKDEINKIYKVDGITPLRNFLQQFDYESFTTLHENDHYRIIRAVEFFKLHNKKISEEKHQLNELEPYNLLKSPYNHWEILHCHLEIPKDIHWEIIEKRAKQMVNDGLIQEVENLLKSGFTGQEKTLQLIGYKETLEYIQSEQTLDECIEKIFISTRQLAKAQRTFFNKMKSKTSYNPINTSNKLINDIINFVNS